MNNKSREVREHSAQVKHPSHKVGVVEEDPPAGAVKGISSDL